MQERGERLRCAAPRASAAGFPHAGHPRSLRCCVPGFCCRALSPGTAPQPPTGARLRHTDDAMEIEEESEVVEEARCEVRNVSTHEQM